MGEAEAAPDATMRPPPLSCHLWAGVFLTMGALGSGVELGRCSPDSRVGKDWGHTHAATVHETGVVQAIRRVPSSSLVVAIARGSKCLEGGSLLQGKASGHDQEVSKEQAS